MLLFRCTITWRWSFACGNIPHVTLGGMSASLLVTVGILRLGSLILIFFSETAKKGKLPIDISQRLLDLGERFLNLIHFYIFSFKILYSLIGPGNGSYSMLVLHLQPPNLVFWSAIYMWITHFMKNWGRH